MKLLTKELMGKLPTSQSISEAEDPKVYCKFFHPCSSWTWYVLAADAVDKEGNYHSLKEGIAHEDIIFFGLVDGFEIELGDFSYNELSTVIGPLGLGMERDMYFTPAPLSQIRKEVEARKGI